MPLQDFLVIWAISTASIFLYRVLPFLLLRGRALSPRFAEALGYIPPAAFAALVANDLLSPNMFAAGIWPGAFPLLAAAAVVLVAVKTKSMLWSCVAGTALYALLSLV